MTPHTNTPGKLTQEASKELDKAKNALTNCVLLELTDRTGNPMILQDTLLADKIERLWVEVLKQLIPHTARVVQGGEGLKVLQGGTGW